MKGEGVLVYWFELHPDVQREWADWYIRDHMPSRLGTTFNGARCFRLASGASHFMVLYDTSTLEALISPDYLTLLKTATDDDRRRRAWYERTMRGCCRKAADVGSGQGGMLGSIRFSLRRGSPADADPIRQELTESIAKIERIGRAAYLDADATIRAKMDGSRTSGLGDAAADQALLIECSSQEDFADALGQLETMPAWRTLADPATVKSDCYRMLYSIAK